MSPTKPAVVMGCYAAAGKCKLGFRREEKTCLWGGASRRLSLSALTPQLFNFLKMTYTTLPEIGQENPLEEKRKWGSGERERLYGFQLLFHGQSSKTPLGMRAIPCQQGK